MGYDLIILNEVGFVKGIVFGFDMIYLNYCCLLMCYIWDQYYVYCDCVGFFIWLLMLVFVYYFCIWDVVVVMWVDYFFVDLMYVVNCICKFYCCDVDVVYLLVMIDVFLLVFVVECGDYYLWCGELVCYKWFDFVIEVFNVNGKLLVVIGDGEECKWLEVMVKLNIIFLGKVVFDVFKYYVVWCWVLVFLGEEDFGIVLFEVQVAGCLVIVFVKGGVLEMVIDGKMGIFFVELNSVDLNVVIEWFEVFGLGEYCEVVCCINVEKFSEVNFQVGVVNVFEWLGWMVDLQYVL